MTTIPINADIIAGLFKNASWNYVTNGVRVSDATMKELIEELNGTHFTMEEIEAAILCTFDPVCDLENFGNQSEIKDFNVYVGLCIADYLARKKVSFHYEGVTYLVIF